MLVCATIYHYITKHRPRSITLFPILCSLYTYHPYKHPIIILIKTMHFLPSFLPSISVSEYPYLFPYSLFVICIFYSARIIQRTARKRMLMYFRGEPVDKELELIARMKAKKKVAYVPRPW